MFIVCFKLTIWPTFKTKRNEKIIQLSSILVSFSMQAKPKISLSATKLQQAYTQQKIPGQSLVRTRTGKPWEIMERDARAVLSRWSFIYSIILVGGILSTALASLSIISLTTIIIHGCTAFSMLPTMLGAL